MEETTIQRLWEPNTLKLFVSHGDTHKAQAHSLSDQLKEYGVSCFVAHDSIEPDEEWQTEIEKALQSMDAMLAFITDDFFLSAWTNQEIGYAIAKGVPIVSLKLEGQDPIGFIKDRQAIKGKIDEAKNFAEPVFHTLEKRMNRSEIWRKIIISRFCNSVTFQCADAAFSEMQGLVDISSSEIDTIVKAFNSNSQISECWAVKRGIKIFLNKSRSQIFVTNNNKLSAIQSAQLDDDIPF